MRDSLLAPLGMAHSTFDRAQVHAATNRAVGHSGIVGTRVDVPMTAAGGLWASVNDLSRFLEFQLGDGTIDGRTLLDPALMQEMRTVPAPDAGAPAGYALGVSRTHWRVGQTWTCSSTAAAGRASSRTCGGSHSCSSASRCSPTPTSTPCRAPWPWGSCSDLVTDPDSRYHDRMLALPTQDDVVEPDGKFVAPVDLANRIAAVAMPSSREQAERWAGYAGDTAPGRPVR